MSVHVIEAPFSSLRSLLVQQRQPGVQLHQDGQGHERVKQAHVGGEGMWYH